MAIKDHIKQIIKFQKARDWKQFHSPKNLAISLALEAAEIIELFQWSKDNNLPTDKKADLADEIADTYYYLLLLSHETGIDIQEAFDKKMRKNAEKYPVEKAKGNSTKYNKL